MYSNCVDALRDAVAIEQNLRNGEAKAGKIEIHSTIAYLRNGLRRCAVQVVGRSGCSYRVEATGLEAEELYREATRLKLVVESDADGIDLCRDNAQFSI